jgi:hypothetical protein
MKVIIDKKGPVGGDETCRDLCHFENPQTPKICEVISFLLSHHCNWGYLEVHESYDSVKDELGKRIAKFEYSHGALLKSDYSYLKDVNGRIVVEHGDIETLKEKRVKLASIVGGWTCFNYHVYLVE